MSASSVLQQLAAQQKVQQQAFGQSIPGRIQKILINTNKIEALPAPASYDAGWEQVVRSNYDAVQEIKADISQLFIGERPAPQQIEELKEAEGKLVKMLSEQSYYHSLSRVSGCASWVMKEISDVFAPVAVPVAQPSPPPEVQKDLNPAQVLINSCKETFAKDAPKVVAKVGGWVNTVAKPVYTYGQRYVAEPAARAVAEYFTTNYPKQTKAVVGFKGRAVIKAKTIYPKAKAKARAGVVYTRPLIDSAKEKTTRFVLDKVDPALKGDVAPGVVAAAAVVVGSGLTLMTPVAAAAAGVVVSKLSKSGKSARKLPSVDLSPLLVALKPLQAGVQELRVLSQVEAEANQIQEEVVNHWDFIDAVIQESLSECREEAANAPRDDDRKVADGPAFGNDGYDAKYNEQEAVGILAGLANDGFVPFEEEPGAAEVYDVVEIDPQSGYRVDSHEHKVWTELL